MKILGSHQTSLYIEEALFVVIVGNSASTPNSPNFECTRISTHTVCHIAFSVNQHVSNLFIIMLFNDHMMMYM